MNNLTDEQKYQDWLINKSWAYLKRINIELCSVCNLRCIYCTIKRTPDRPKFLDINIFKKLLDEICSSPAQLQELGLYQSGESLLHPQFFDFVDLVGKYKKNFSHFNPLIYMHTNAVLLDEVASDRIIEDKIFGRLVFSIDGRDKESFERMRPGAEYETVMDNVEYFLNKNNGTIRVAVNNLVDKECEDIPLDHRMKKVFDRAGLYGQSRMSRPHYPANLPGATKDPGYYTSPQEPLGLCWYIFHTVVLTTSGKIAQCSLDLQELTTFGDFTKKSFEEIYFGPERQKRIEIMMNKRRDLLPACATCYVSNHPDKGYGELAEHRQTS